MAETKAADALQTSAGEAGAGVVRLGPEALAWTVEKGGTLENPVARIAERLSRQRQTVTTRNLRTLLKVVEAAEALG